MNKNLLILIFLVCSAYSKGQNSAFITFDSLTINYGKILQGEDGTVDFKFTNTGDRDLKINRVRSSCGCTIPKKPDSLIAPGVSDLIKVKYDTERIGIINKTIIVNSNAANGTVILKITGEILDPENIKEIKEDI
ncbi:MAG: hypothetical protein CMD11_03355 [Flavobacteriales bacterium]|nr:hypothetical protein [Flavobacteriales bacterium]|tara:strand:+ start:28 stop:432 length:405 start_codon:yes stop_codon:yes gene_type:complete